jgi:hypothetical protein
MQSLAEKPESDAAAKPEEQEWNADGADSAEQEDRVPSYRLTRGNSENIPAI